MRQPRFVVWIMIVATVGGSLPAMAAPTPATWGGIKQLYTGEAEILLGPGVGSAQAAEAMRCAVAFGEAGFEGPARVRCIGNSPLGRLFAVMGPGPGEVVDVHLVTEAGGYIGGARVDPAAGTIRDRATGALLLRHDGLRSVDQEVMLLGIIDTLVQVARTLCSSVINPIVNRIFSDLFSSQKINWETLAFLGLCAIILDACASFMDTHVEQMPEANESCCPPAPAN